MTSYSPPNEWLKPFLRGNICDLGSDNSAKVKTLAPQSNYISFTLGSYDPAMPIQIPSASQDVVLVLDLLHKVRMDQLYMTIAEARRILKPGGHCLMRTFSFTPSRSGKFAASVWNRFSQNQKALDIHHYISPEDWNVLSELRSSDSFLNWQTVELARL